MNLRRMEVLLAKEFTYGSRSTIVVFAIVAPIAISLALTLAFGGLFSEKPRLGIADQGASELTGLVADVGAVASKQYDSAGGLREAVAAGGVDMGVVLPAGFDAQIRQGVPVELTAYVWGESLAVNRALLEATLTRLVREVAGQAAPVEVTTTTLGEAEPVAWEDRLLPLVVLLAVIMGGSMVPASSLVDEKQKGTLVPLTVTPARLEEVLVTKGVLGVLLSMTMGVVILVLNRAIGVQPVLLLAVLTMGAVLAASFGILLGTLTKDITTLFATFKSMGLLLYAPAIVYLFPGVPQWIGRVFPTYYIVAPVIGITQEGAGLRDVAAELVVLAALIVVLIGLVALAVRRTQERSA